MRWLTPAAALLAAALLCLPTAGCTRGPRRAAPVNAERAREALRETLEAWKKGERPEALRERSPAITAQDMDWESGHRLIGYEVLGGGKELDANLECPVRLTLRDPQGREARKDVQYIVGTDPSITVFRKLF